jgi:hypothetical protein
MASKSEWIADICFLRMASGKIVSGIAFRVSVMA